MPRKDNGTASLENLYAIMALCAIGFRPQAIMSALGISRRLYFYRVKAARGKSIGFHPTRLKPLQPISDVG